MAEILDHPTLRDYIIPIAIAYLLAIVVHLISRRVVARLVGISDFAPETLRLRDERRRTLHDLLASVVSVSGFSLATLFTLGRFVDATTLVWLVGLLSAGFGFGARPLISDFLTGMNFIFEDLVDVGDKVEIMGVQGVVEKINLRTMLVRAPTGDLYVIPNGEVRIIRNFSRGLFSTADIKLKIYAHDLSRTLELLETLGEESVTLVPDLLEPWKIISASGEMGEHVELTLAVKTRFGKAAEIRPRLLKLVHDHLSEAGLALVD